MKLTTVLSAAILSGWAATAGAQVINESVCGASPGGLWSLVGTGLDSAVKATAPGSTITYQTSSGGLANVVQVQNGGCAFGMANDGDLAFAVAGTEPFREPVEGLTALAVLYDWAPIWWIARADFVEEYGIDSIADLAEVKPPVRVAFNRRGLLTSAITMAEFEALGITEDEVESWGGSIQYQASAEQTTLMRDGRIDILANTLFEGHSTLSQMTDAVELRLLQTPDDVAEQVIETFKLKPWTIAAENNPGDNGDIKTVTTSIILFATEDLDEETAYTVTKSMIDNPANMAAVSAAMERFAPEGMLGQDVVPFHPGAIRAYTEAGLM